RAAASKSRWGRRSGGRSYPRAEGPAVRGVSTLPRARRLRLALGGPGLGPGHEQSNRRQGRQEDARKEGRCAENGRGEERGRPKNCVGDEVLFLQGTLLFKVGRA